MQHVSRCHTNGLLLDSAGLVAAVFIVYLSHAFVDIKVEFPAHIETDPVAVAGLVVYIDEGDLDGIGALRVERHPVRAAVFGVSEEFVDAFSGGELSFNFVHLLPSSLRRHL